MRSSSSRRHPGRSPMQRFYRKALRILDDAGIPFLVGGAHGLRHFTGVYRDTKDLDLFVRPADHVRGLKALEAGGFPTVLTYPHWLAKATHGEYFIDIIFSSGNAIGRVDDAWFTHAVEGEVLGLPVRICPVEEIIWSKAFIMERERYDGADIMHLLLACCDSLDWSRLLQRFGPHWRVLFSYLTLFGFVYPSRRSGIPGWVMRDLMHRLAGDMSDQAARGDICQGTLLSRVQYQIDIDQWGFKDARLAPIGKMTADDIAHASE